MAKEKEFNFWNDHSLEFLEMSMKRDFQERVVSCDGIGTASRECGDTITFFLKAEAGQLAAISYDVQGCIYTHACANTIIHLTRGQSLDRAAAVTAQEIIDYLQTLPEKEAHCAALALKAFHRALADLG